jgi:hypothetical protein
MSSRFSLQDVRGICVDVFHQRELAAEQARLAQERAAQARSRGVSWSGLSHAPAAPVRSPERIRADAEAACARAAAFAQSPRGRFLAAVAALEALGLRAEPEAARAAYARGFADPDRPACPTEIGRALTALGRLGHAPAGQACAALAELLAEAVTLAAA